MRIEHVEIGLCPSAVLCRQYSGTNVWYDNVIYLAIGILQTRLMEFPHLSLTRTRLLASCALRSGSVKRVNHQIAIFGTSIDVRPLFLRLGRHYPHQSST